MSGGGVLWAEAPDDDGDVGVEADTHGDVDETFAARRLRRWIKGMFGGQPPKGDAEPRPEE